MSWKKGLSVVNKGGEVFVGTFDMRRRLVVVLACVLSAIVLASCSSTKAPTKGVNKLPAVSRREHVTTVRFQVYPGTLVNLLTYVAKDEGFFEKNGINAVLVPIASSPAGASALSSGSIDVLSASPDGALTFVAKGLRAEVIAGQSKQIFQLIIRRGFGVKGKYPDDLRVLRGKTVGVTAVGAASEDLVLAMLKDAGVPASTVHFVGVGAAATAEAAFQSGSIDALSYYAPVTTVPVLEGKARVLANVGVKGQGPRGAAGADYVAEWVSPSYLVRHASVVHEIQKAFAEAEVWMRDSKNFVGVEKIVKSIVGTAVPAQYLAKFTRENLPIYDVASYNKKAMLFWDSFDLHYGLIKSLIPVDTVLAASTPSDLMAVEKLAK